MIHLRTVRYGILAGLLLATALSAFDAHAVPSNGGNCNACHAGGPPGQPPAPPPTPPAPTPEPAPIPVPNGPTVPVIEYRNAALDHYFVTAAPAEIAKLDAGLLIGWARTGQSFNAYPTQVTGSVGVCRFYNPSLLTHFYGADWTKRLRTRDRPGNPSRDDDDDFDDRDDDDGDEDGTAGPIPAPAPAPTPTPAPPPSAQSNECAILKGNPGWAFESIAFYAFTPDAAGLCPTGTVQLFRVYNNSISGSPNHRYTTDLALRDRMLGQGWAAEGYGPYGVTMCVAE